MGGRKNYHICRENVLRQQEDERLGYVDVQIDKSTLHEITAILSKVPEAPR